MRLKTIRINKGLTQQALADAIGENRSTLAMWETNRARPKPEALIKLADALGVSIDLLLRTKENE